MLWRLAACFWIYIQVQHIHVFYPSVWIRRCVVVSWFYIKLKLFFLIPFSLWINLTFSWIRLFWLVFMDTFLSFLDKSEKKMEFKLNFTPQSVHENENCSQPQISDYESDMQQESSAFISAFIINEWWSKPWERLPWVVSLWQQSSSLVSFPVVLPFTGIAVCLLEGSHL